MCHFIVIGEFQFELPCGNTHIRAKLSVSYLLVTLEYKRWPRENNMAPRLCYFKRCASFQRHRGIKSVVRVRKCSIRVKIGDFFVPCDFEDWRLVLTNGRTDRTFLKAAWSQLKGTLRTKVIKSLLKRRIPRVYDELQPRKHHPRWRLKCNLTC